MSFYTICISMFCHFIYFDIWNILSFELFVIFFFFIRFLANQESIFFHNFYLCWPSPSPAAKYHPRWQPTRRWAISCGLGIRRIRTRDCRTTVWRTTIEPPRLPLSHHAFLSFYTLCHCIHFVTLYTIWNSTVYKFDVFSLLPIVSWLTFFH